MGIIYPAFSHPFQSHRVHFPAYTLFFESVVYNVHVFIEDVMYDVHVFIEDVMYDVQWH